MLRYQPAALALQSFLCIRLVFPFAHGKVAESGASEEVAQSGDKRRAQGLIIAEKAAAASPKGGDPVFGDV